MPRRESAKQQPSTKGESAQQDAWVIEILSSHQDAPLDSLGLARLLRKRSKVLAADLETWLDRLERSGRIVRIKGDRYTLPEAAQLVTGRIQFRASGSAWLLPESDAQHGSGRAEEIQIFEEDAGVALHGDRVVVRLEAEPRRVRGKETQCGRVIRILERAHPTVVGSLQRSRHYHHVIPDDPRLTHDILVPDPVRSGLRPQPRVGDKVVVRLLEWTQRHAPPEGEIIEVLGKNTEPGVELRAIFLKHKLPQSFPPDVLAEVKGLPTQVRPADLADREDFRQVPTCTIDPDDARDFDDALSLECLPNGDFRVGVHIADVANYVRPGTALDREARTRGNSTYLIGTVVPMLPEQLSNGLCSLVEGEDRLTKSAIFTFSNTGEQKSVRFANTVIRSRKRLTYKQAHALLFAKSLEDVRRIKPPPAHQTGSPGKPLASLGEEELLALRDQVRTLWKLASKLRAERMAAGSLDLEMPETKIFVDPSGWADRIERIEHDESHQLIEEFMLLANESVARRTRSQRLPSVYRVHDDPDPDKLQEFRDYVAALGVQTGALHKRSVVVDLLARLREHPQGYTARTQFLRSLRKACYRTDPDGHYGLAKKDYTHFTSPIRRYADLLVHRVVAFDLAGRKGSAPHSAAQIRGFAEHLSLTEVNSAEAEREHHKIKLVEFFERDLQRTPRSRFPAVLTDVRSHGLFIEVTEPFLLGFIHLSALKDDFYQVSPDGTAAIGRRTRRRLATGDRVHVQIERVDRIKRQFDFTLAEGPNPDNRMPAVPEQKPGAPTKDRPGRSPKAQPRTDRTQQRGKQDRTGRRSGKR